MPGRRSFPFAPVALGALASFLLAGCTAVGFGTGAVADWHHGKRPANGLAEVRTGTNITVWLRDGRKLHGQFLGCRDSLSATPLPMPASNQGNLVPLSAVVVLGTSAGPQQFPIELVKRISVPVHYGKWKGAILGFVVDAALVIGAASSGGAPR